MDNVMDKITDTAFNLVPRHMMEAYDAALSKLEPETAKQVHLVYERVAHMWRCGVRLHHMAQELGLHRDRIMEIVRGLDLPDRCPATCNPTEMMAQHYATWPVTRLPEDPADYGPRGSRANAFDELLGQIYGPGPPLTPEAQAH